MWFKICYYAVSDYYNFWKVFLPRCPRESRAPPGQPQDGHAVEGLHMMERDLLGCAAVCEGTQLPFPLQDLCYSCNASRYLFG